MVAKSVDGEVLGSNFLNMHSPDVATVGPISSKVICPHRVTLVYVCAEWWPLILRSYTHILLSLPCRPLEQVAC